MYYAELIRLTNGLLRLRIYRDTVDQTGFIMSTMDDDKNIQEELAYWRKRGQVAIV